MGGAKTSDAARAAPEPGAAPPRPDPDPLINTTQIERLLHIASPTFWTWRKTGTFAVPPFYDAGGPVGAKLWRQSDVLRWIAERPRRKDPGVTTWPRGGHTHLNPAPARNIFSRPSVPSVDLTGLRVLRMPQVTRLAGVHPVRICKWEAAGKFPQRISLGPNVVAWFEHEVRGWLSARRRAQRAVTATVRQGLRLRGRYLLLTTAQKRAIIRRVQRSELPVDRTLAELGVCKGTFYLWCRKLGLRPPRRKRWTAAEKAAVIHRVQRSRLPVDRLLAHLGIRRGTFYAWSRQAGIRLREARRSRG